MAIITTRNTAWLNPHCNTTELVRLLLYLHSIPRFVMLLGWQGRQLLPCPLCLSGRWELRQEWKEVDFLGLGTWSRQSWNYTGGSLLLGWTSLCSASTLPVLYMPCTHGVVELGVCWMFSCFAVNPSHSCYPSLVQKMGFGSYHGAVMQQLCDSVVTWYFRARPPSWEGGRICKGWESALMSGWKLCLESAGWSLLQLLFLSLWQTLPPHLITMFHF